ncbi:hypothetical protein HML84_08860 [Alcanivorax sp. IO_7]|nr:hypothetical protein HML84_08860 [Alcanivorax sp. IO_7]
MLAVLPGAWRYWQADYRAPVGDTLALTLSDGSRVMLGAGSALAEDFTAGRRRCGCWTARRSSRWRRTGGPSWSRPGDGSPGHRHRFQCARRRPGLLRGGAGRRGGGALPGRRAPPAAR